MKPPTAFISYSCITDEQSNRVLNLANKFREYGIDANIDQFEHCPPEGWQRWMESQISSSDFVLMIIDETYYNKIYGRPGSENSLGVKWEGNLIYQELYSSGTINNKFIPILFDENNKEFIPAPLRGATHYNVSIQTRFAELIKRMRGEDKSYKAPLGEKQRVINPGMFVTGFIDVELWDKAGWTGMAYLFDKQLIEPPVIGFRFRNEEAAFAIFKKWQTRLGSYDAFEEMRITIMEDDDINNPNYVVFVGVNADRVLDRAEKEGINLPNEYLLLIGRTHFMTPKTNRNLEIFKENLLKVGSYYLAPFIETPDSTQPILQLKILKKQIIFKRIGETKEKDIDSIAKDLFLEKNKIK